MLSNPTQRAIELVYQAILTNGILPKFCQQVILMGDLLNNDEATLLLIQDCAFSLLEYRGFQGLNHLQIHILFKDVAHRLLNAVTVTENSSSSFGAASLEGLLFQRLKHLL